MPVRYRLRSTRLHWWVPPPAPDYSQHHSGRGLVSTPACSITMPSCSLPLFYVQPASSVRLLLKKVLSKLHGGAGVRPGLPMHSSGVHGILPRLKATEILIRPLPNMP